MTLSLEQLRRDANSALRNPSAPGAVAAMQALVQAQPDRAEHWFNLAYLCRMTGDYRALWPCAGAGGR